MTKQRCMINEWLTGKHMEENRYGLIQVLSQHFPRGTEKNQQNPHASWRPTWDLNQAPLKYKSQALQLDQHVQSSMRHDLIITNREVIRVRKERHLISYLAAHKIIQCRRTVLVHFPCQNLQDIAGSQHKSCSVTYYLLITKICYSFPCKQPLSNWVPWRKHVQWNLPSICIVF
jgi:hypothetical protein